jgi:hypothetical protein
MLFSIRTTAIGIIVLGWLAAVGTAADVRDRARLFTSAARGQANEEIRALKRQYHINLLLETNEPGGLRLWFRSEPVNTMEPEARAQQFTEWGQRGVREAGPNSVFILIYKEGPQLYVHVDVGSDPAVQKTFSPAARAELHDRLLARLKEGRADGGLAEAVGTVRSTLDAHLGGPVAPTPPANWTPIAWALLVIVGAWLLIEALQVATGGHAGGGAVGLSAGSFGGGGNFMTGLFATMAGGQRSAAPRLGMAAVDDWFELGPFPVQPQPPRLEERIRAAEAPAPAREDLSVPAHDPALDRYHTEPSEPVHGEP